MDGGKSVTGIRTAFGSHNNKGRNLQNGRTRNLTHTHIWDLEGSTGKPLNEMKPRNLSDPIRLVWY